MSQIVPYIMLTPGEPGAQVRFTTRDAALVTFQAAVDGWVERIALGPCGKGRQVVALVNEEGLLRNLPWCLSLPGGQPLAGPVLFLVEEDGPEGWDWASMTEGEGAAITGFILGECAAMLPTPSSVEGYERRTGRPAIGVTDMNGKPL